jgi:hypothetical protein
VQDKIVRKGTLLDFCLEMWLVTSHISLRELSQPQTQTTPGANGANPAYGARLAPS